MHWHVCARVCRWDGSKPASVNNLVLLTFDEAEAHEAQGLEAAEHDDPDFARFVNDTLSQIK